MGIILFLDWNIHIGGHCHQATTSRVQEPELNEKLLVPSSARGSLELKGDFVVAKQHAHDIFLVDLAMDSQRFKPAQLKQVNYCRMYLNILVLSDITTAKGDYIDPLMFLGEAQPVITKHRVNQAKPSAKAWKQWSRLLLMLTHNSPHL